MPGRTIDRLNSLFVPISLTFLTFFIKKSKKKCIKVTILFTQYNEITTGIECSLIRLKRKKRIVTRNLLENNIKPQTDTH